MQAQLPQETETEPLIVMDISAHSAWRTGSERRKYIIAVVKALCCKPEGRGFVTRWSECIFFFSVYLIFPAALGQWVHSASNRNEHQKQENVSD
jgi:hypothetical protein